MRISTCVFLSITKYTTLTLSKYVRNSLLHWMLATFVQEAMWSMSLKFDKLTYLCKIVVILSAAFSFDISLGFCDQSLLKRNSVYYIVDINFRQNFARFLLTGISILELNFSIRPASRRHSCCLWPANFLVKNCVDEILGSKFA